MTKHKNVNKMYFFTAWRTKNRFHIGIFRSESKQQNKNNDKKDCQLRIASLMHEKGLCEELSPSYINY